MWVDFGVAAAETRVAEEPSGSIPARMGASVAAVERLGASGGKLLRLGVRGEDRKIFSGGCPSSIFERVWFSFRGTSYNFYSTKV